MKITAIDSTRPIQHPRHGRPVHRIEANEGVDLEIVSDASGIGVGVSVWHEQAPRKRTLVPFGLCVVQYELAPEPKAKPSPVGGKAKRRKGKAPVKDGAQS